MAEFFILLKIENGKIKPVKDILKKIPEIKSIASNNAEPSLAIFIKLNFSEDLHNFISKRLSKITWIKKIETGIVVKKQQNEL